MNFDLGDLGNESMRTANLSVPLDPARTIHIIPLDDLRDHWAMGLACACRPTALLIPGGGTVVAHSAWDCRERFEEGWLVAAEGGGTR